MQKTAGEIIIILFLLTIVLGLSTTRYNPAKKLPATICHILGIFGHPQNIEHGRCSGSSL